MLFACSFVIRSFKKPNVNYKTLFFRSYDGILYIVYKDVFRSVQTCYHKYFNTVINHRVRITVQYNEFAADGRSVSPSYSYNVFIRNIYYRSTATWEIIYCYFRNLSNFMINCIYETRSVELSAKSYAWCHNVSTTRGVTLGYSRGLLECLNKECLHIIMYET